MKIFSLKEFEAIKDQLQYPLFSVGLCDNEESFNDVTYHEDESTIGYSLKACLNYSYPSVIITSPVGTCPLKQSEPRLIVKIVDERVRK